MRKLVIGVASLLLIACGDSIAGLDGARRISGEPLRADFMATAECVGVSNDSASLLFGKTRWFRAPALPADTPGLWVEPYGVYLRRGLNTAPFVARHEVIHLILQDGTHRHSAFGASSDAADACESPHYSD